MGGLKLQVLIFHFSIINRIVTTCLRIIFLVQVLFELDELYMKVKCILCIYMYEQQKQFRVFLTVYLRHEIVFKNT